MIELAWPLTFCVVSLTIAGMVLWWKTQHVNAFEDKVLRLIEKNVVALEAVNKRVNALEHAKPAAPDAELKADVADLKSRFDKLAIAVGLGSVAYKGKA